MKNKSVKVFASLLMMMVASCDEPQTIVTNIVHPDGSVTRKIEMRSLENKFEKDKLQVPFDNTWIAKDSIELNEKGDTTWVKRIEKTFRNIDEINLAYKNDSGPDRKFLRTAGFEKKFRWFHTRYRFSETINKHLSFGYPVKDFLNDEELNYFYSPEDMKLNQENGPESEKYKALADSVKNKTDHWTMKNLVSGWIDEFTELADNKSKTGKSFTRESLKSRENELVSIVKLNENKFDSLWQNGTVLKQILGDKDAENYKAEADTAMEHVIKKVIVDFKGYSVRIVMPGNLIGTNGFIDSSKTLIWPVQSDFFMTQNYEMWAESRTSNSWAWIVSVLFLLFVLSGIVIRIVRRG